MFRRRRGAIQDPCDAARPEDGGLLTIAKYFLLLNFERVKLPCAQVAEVGESPGVLSLTRKRFRAGLPRVPWFGDLE